MNWVALAEHWKRTRADILLACPDIDPETLRDTVEGQSDALDLARHLIRASREDAALAAGVAEYIGDMQARYSNFMRRAEKREAAALSLLLEIGEKTLRDPAFTAYVSATPGKVKFSDTSLLPAWAWRTFDPEPNTAEIRERLTAGEIVPGALLDNGGQTLRVLT